MSGFIPPLERQQTILDMLARNRRITVAEICAKYAISEATARRDLEALSAQGKLQRVHGGATSIDKAPPELPGLSREQEQADEKRRIGRAAAGLVLEGETVF